MLRFALSTWLAYEWYVADDLTTMENIILCLIFFTGFTSAKEPK